MSESLGTIRGQMILDVKQALASYTAVRQQHVSTVTALSTGGAAIATAGAMVAGAGIAMGAGLLTAVNAAAEFERKLDYFIAVGGPGAADKYDEVSAKALQLGADTIYSADQIADSFVELAKSGVSAEDIINGIGEGVAALGAAADIPLDTAANIITSAVATFQLGAENAVMVADKLAGAANASIIDVQDLGVSLKYVGGVAASLGVPFEDVNTALAILGENGIKGSTAGTSLRQVLLGLNGSTAKAKNALEELGIITEDGTNKFYNMDGSAKSLAEVFQILQDATAGMTDQQKTATMQQIFATRALPSLIALTREGAAGFAEMAAEIGKTTAFDVASQRLDNLSGDLEILRGNFDTLMITAGGPFQNMARGIVQGITSMLQAFMDLPQGTQTAILSIMGVVSALLILVGFAGILSGAILNIIGLAIRMGPAFTAVGGALKGVSTAIFGLFALLRTNPFALIVTAIAAVVAGLVFFFTKTETGQAIWAKFMEALQSALAVVMPWLEKMIDTVGGALTEAFNALMPVLASVVEFLGGVFVSILPTIVSVLEGIISAVGPILEALVSALGVVGTALAPLFDSFAESGTRIATAFAPVIDVFIAELLPALVELGAAFADLVTMIAPLIAVIAGQLMNLLFGLISAILPPLIELFAALAPIIAQLVGVLVQFGVEVLGVLIPPLMQLISAIMPVLVALFEAVVPIVMALAQAFLPLIQTIVEMLIPTIQFLLEIVTVIFEQLAPIIEAALNIVVSIIQTVTALLKGDWEGVWNGILGILEGVWNLIVAVVTGTINAVVAIVQAALNWIVQGWTTAWNNVSNFLTQAWANISAGVSNGINAVLTFFRNLPGQILGAIAGIGSWLLSAGQDLINGLVRGIQNAGGAVMDAIGGVVNGAIDWAKGLLGIASPSKVFTAIGKFTIQGLTNGIASMRGSLNRQMTQVANDITSFYDQVGAAKELDAQINLAGSSADASFGLNNSVAAQLAALTAKMQEIADKDTFVVEKLEVNNPEPEPASESLPNAVRKTAYMVG